MSERIFVLSFVHSKGPKILYEQEHSADQFLVKNFSVKVRWENYELFTYSGLNYFHSLVVTVF